MGFEGDLPQGIEGVGPSFVEALYQRYLTDPASVDESFRRYFEGVERVVAQGPSWAKPNWPPTTTTS